MWFGQKEDGTTGFFEREKAVKIDDDDQGMLLDRQKLVFTIVYSISS